MPNWDNRLTAPLFPGSGVLGAAAMCTDPGGPWMEEDGAANMHIKSNSTWKGTSRNYHIKESPISGLLPLPLRTASHLLITKHRLVCLVSEVSGQRCSAVWAEWATCASAIQFTDAALSKAPHCLCPTCSADCAWPLIHNPEMWIFITSCTTGLLLPTSALWPIKLPVALLI